MSYEEPNKNQEMSSDNIFQDFGEIEEVKKQVLKEEEKIEKDAFYYLGKLNLFLLILNGFLFVALLLSSIYIYIQRQEEKKPYSSLSSLCYIFLGRNDVFPGECYPITPVLNEYTLLLEQNQSNLAKTMMSVLEDVYKLENYMKSRRFSFLLEKTQDRLRPLEMLAKFDEIKSKFSPIDRFEISCYDITFSNISNMNVICDVYSSDWDKSITTLSDSGIGSLQRGGTSISKASSFIHFLENYPGSPFRVVSSPTIFDFEETQFGPYTRKTIINLNLEYKNLETLSF